MLDEYRSRASFCTKRMRQIFEDEPSQEYRVKSTRHFFFFLLLILLFFRTKYGQY